MIYRIVAASLMLVFGVLAFVLHGDKQSDSSKTPSAAPQSPNVAPAPAPAGNKNFNL